VTRTHLLDLTEMVFTSLATHPLLLALTMLVATFFLEDVATVAAGLLASSMVLAPAPALLAVLVGTILGDLALHLTGRGLAKTAWGRRLRSSPYVGAAESWLAGRSLAALALARFIPGLRLPVYTASGFVRTPFLHVAGIVTAVSLIWTPAVFWLSATAGAAGARLPTGVAAGIALVALLLTALAPNLTRRVISV
jgi:membrane protein DedA with SNARE-associated domain